MKMNIYMIVFGVVILLIILAAAASFLLAPPGTGSGQNASNVSLADLPNYGPAPNIQGIADWINSPPLNMTQLRGKVVLIDFWTYSCINCIRTIPHLNAWYNEYGNNGLVIIGVHTPEFDFEKNYTNVLNAVRQFGIKYPVALDSNYSTWIAYNNHYWPADYIIDKNGDIRAEQFGEGNYNTTEQIIRELLVNAGYTVPSYTTNSSLGVNFTAIGSPEMYFGYQEIGSGRTDYIGNSQGLVPNQVTNYTLPNISQPNTIYLSGKWYSAPDSLISEGGDIILIYKARKVNVVASGNGTYANTSIVVRLDDANLNSSSLGSDAHLVNGSAVVDVGPSRLYNIVSTPSYGVHEVEIIAQPGFRIYTFTFG